MFENFQLLFKANFIYQMKAGHDQVRLLLACPHYYSLHNSFVCVDHYLLKLICLSNKHTNSHDNSEQPSIAFTYASRAVYMEQIKRTGMVFCGLVWHKGVSTAYNEPATVSVMLTCVYPVFSTLKYASTTFHKGRE